MSKAIIVAGLLMLIGCVSGGHSTRLSDSDLQYTVSEIQAQINQSEYLNRRNSASPPAVIAVVQAENQTCDVLSESARFQLVREALHSTAITTLAAEKNLHFMLDGTGDATHPTHALSAVLRSGVRVGQDKEGFIDHRTDCYQMHYTVTNLATGAIAWEGLVEFKRSATGRSID